MEIQIFPMDTQISLPRSNEIPQYLVQTWKIHIIMTQDVTVLASCGHVHD